jgi:hypothetical protein
VSAISCRRSQRGQSGRCSSPERCNASHRGKRPREFRFTFSVTPFTLGLLRFAVASLLLNLTPSIVGDSSNECETSETQQLSNSGSRIVDVPNHFDDATKSSLQLSNPSLGTCRYTRVLCEMDALRISTPRFGTHIVPPTTVMEKRLMSAQSELRIAARYVSERAIMSPVQTGSPSGGEVCWIVLSQELYRIPVPTHPIQTRA